MKNINVYDSRLEYECNTYLYLVAAGKVAEIGNIC